MDENIYNKITNLVDKNIQAKIDSEMSRIHDAVNKDKETVELCLDMIQKNLVYKDIAQYGWGHRYILATPEMFFEDYLKEVESYRKGVKFTEYKKDSDNYLYYGVFQVNGERYYDMRYLLRKYEKDVKNTLDKLNLERDRLHEICNEYEEAVKSWPEVKKLVEDWNKKTEGEIIGNV